MRTCHYNVRVLLTAQTVSSLFNGHSSFTPPTTEQPQQQKQKRISRLTDLILDEWKKKNNKSFAQKFASQT